MGGYLIQFQHDQLLERQHCRKIDTDKSSGSCTVPDPNLTPGEMDASWIP
jgi:hypothetical protein